jgi:hypothetical protein
MVDEAEERKKWFSKYYLADSDTTLFKVRVVYRTWIVQETRLSGVPSSFMIRTKFSLPHAIPLPRPVYRYTCSLHAPDLVGCVGKTRACILPLQTLNGQPPSRRDPRSQPGLRNLMQAPTIWNVLDSWAANSTVGLQTERRRFVRTHMADTDNILEILLRLVRGECATPFTGSTGPAISP